MSALANFMATYSDMRLVKGRKVVQFVFEVPLEASNAALDALGGVPNPAAEVWCAIARLDPAKIAGDALLLPERSAREATEGSKAAPPAPAASRLTTRAVMLCKDALFRRFLEDHAKMENVTEDEAAVYVRTRCGVASRSEIKPGTSAATKLDFVESAYLCWKEKYKYVEEAAI